MRRPRVTRLAALAVSLTIAAGAVLSGGTRQSGTATDATEAEARAACTPCHLFPPPDILPKATWRDEIARMSLIRSNLPQPLSSAGQAGRIIPLPPDFERVLQYYVANAPDHLAPPAPWPAPEAGGFIRRAMNPNSPPPDPAVANVRLLDVDGDGKLALLATDMRYGLVMMGKPASGNTRLDVIAQLDNPDHESMADLNGDGIQDFLVADLGTLLPGDHTRGSVTLLLGTKDGKYEQRTLSGWPRVADVEAADFNGDGKLDLAVAAFGWRKVGNFSVLENRTTDYTHPSFTPHLIDPRPGAIHAIPVDLNKDGKMDLVVVFAQQFEQVVVFMNNGGPGVSFTPQVIYTAPHPNWGSSGIQVIDLDGDGDLDVLLTHGDTFDDAVVKPYHGIQWLENRGGFPFAELTLVAMPGVSRAQAVDLDGDGDLDIVACALLASGADIDESTLPALVWLEQTKPGVFERHTLEKGAPRHASFDVGDIDHDGDVDIVVGTFMLVPGSPPSTNWVEIWENQRAH